MSRLAELIRQRKMKPTQYDDPLEEERAQETEQLDQWRPTTTPVSNEDVPVVEEPYRPYSSDKSWAFGTGVDPEIKANYKDDRANSTQDFQKEAGTKFGDAQYKTRDYNNFGKKLLPDPGEVDGLVEPRYTEGDASKWRYGSDQSNKWMEPKIGSVTDIAEKQPSKLEEAVKRKRKPEWSKLQEGFIDPYRMHTANMANQMRTFVSDMSKAVPGVKPLDALDYTEPVKDEIALRQQREAKERQKMLDNLNYLKQLEQGETKRWEPINTKQGIWLMNPYTGEIRPGVDFGLGEGSGAAGLGDLEYKTEDIVANDGSIKKFMFQYSKDTGRYFVRTAEGLREIPDPNSLDLATKQDLANLSASQSASEAANKRLATMAKLNLEKDLAIALPEGIPVGMDKQLASLKGLSDSYKSLISDPVFRVLTTKTDDPVKKGQNAAQLSVWLMNNREKLQAFLKAQADAVNSGVMNAGEATQYTSAILGIDSALLDSPGNTEAKLEFKNLEDFLRAIYIRTARNIITTKEIEDMGTRLGLVARKFPHLITPERTRANLKDIMGRAVEGAKTLVQSRGATKGDVPEGAVDVYDPRVDAYFNKYYGESPTIIPLTNETQPSPAPVGATTPTNTPVQTPKPPPVKKTPTPTKDGKPSNLLEKYKKKAEQDKAGKWPNPPKDAQELKKLRAKETPKPYVPLNKRG